jgi:hypothetical protein
MVQESDGARPFYAHLTGCGRKAWQAFTQAHADEINHPDFPAFLFGPWSKLKGYCGRLALILHYLRWACDEAHSENEVDGESVDRATRLIDYFKGHTKKVYAVMDADPKVAAARKALAWIVSHARKSFARKDAYQGLKGTFKTIEDLDAVLAVLLRHGLIRPQPPQDHPGRGPKPGPAYDVNPFAAAELQEYGNCRNTPIEIPEPSAAPGESDSDNSPSSCNSHDSCDSGPANGGENSPTVAGSCDSHDSRNSAVPRKRRRGVI